MINSPVTVWAGTGYKEAQRAEWWQKIGARLCECDINYQSDAGCHLDTWDPNSQQQILCLVFRHNVNVNSIRIKARLLAAVLVDQATCTDNSIAVIRIEEPNTRDFFLLIALFAAAVAQQAFVFHPSQYFWLMRPSPLSPLSLMIFSLYMCTCVHVYMSTMTRGCSWCDGQ